MKKISSCLALAVWMAHSYAGTMGPVVEVAEPSVYLSAFGGGGTLSRLSLKQLGTVVTPTVAGGAFAVNAFGHSQHRAEWIVGGNAGHYFSTITVPYVSQWSVRPAAEIEGYFIGRNTIHGNDINNLSSNEHDFAVSYPMSVGIGLINAVASFNHSDFAQWHPYVAGGLGLGVVSITSAISTQTTPSEVGVNHYNTDPSATDTAFSSQLKAGLSFDWTEHLSIFGEYRYLYVAATNYIFGSTVYPSHATTSSWDVKFGSQAYNLGVAGLKYVF